ncbi:MAG: hypothetical protein E7587_02145 [Ruminococcaceae bacterium]|nr:hypothetical protein [Oscillospiraceae bacterium]
MSIKRKAVFLLSFTVLFISAVAFRASAYESGQETFSELIDILPDEVRDRIEPSLRENKVSELLRAEFLLDAVISCFCGEITSIGSILCTLLALTVFFAVASMIKTGIGNESIGKIVDNALLIASALAVYSLFSSGLTRVYTYIEDIKRFQNGLIPIMTGLYFSGGNTATAISASAGVGAALVMTENLCARTLPVLVKVCFALTLIGAVGAEINYSALCRSVRNLYMTLLSFFTMILSISMSFGQALASSADSVAARTVKFAIGNMIPIVGSTVNSAYGTLASSLSLIKSTLGASSIVALLLLTLPVIIYLLLLRLSLNICASVSDMLGCAKIGKLYTDFRTVYDLALAAVIFCTLVFIIIISLFVKCAWAVA